MERKTRDFATKAEAEAFVEGVEFVNDGALTVTGIKEEDDRFVVVMEDEDE